MISNKGIRGKLERFVDNLRLTRMLIFRTVNYFRQYLAKKKLTNGKFRKNPRLVTYKIEEK